MTLSLHGHWTYDASQLLWDTEQQLYLIPHQIAELLDKQSE